MNSRSPSDFNVTNANAVLAPSSKQIPSSTTPFCFKIAANMRPNSSAPSFPAKAAFPFIFATAIATFAGAPPGALRNPGASARETPEIVGTKSISISPKDTTSPFVLLSPLIFSAIVECFSRFFEVFCVCFSI
ncbi:hypothetical protein KSS87_001843 [Heliosperma pusillum]|nr:hypothetical protein KSS87_001843 [Heliosperma pusillum]